MNRAENDMVEMFRIVNNWGLGANLASAIKNIILSYGHEDSRCGLLKQAAWYLQREISSLEKKDEPHTDKTGNDGC